MGLYLLLAFHSSKHKTRVSKCGSILALVELHGFRLVVTRATRGDFAYDPMVNVALES